MSLGDILEKPFRELTADERAQLAAEARDRHHLSVIVEPYTELDKRGRSEKVGLCPFHDERSPSFEVNDDKGTYHCWGCGAGGDAISFLMKAKGLRWRQAVEWLLGAELPAVSPEERAQRKADDIQRRQARLALAQFIWSASTDPVGTPAEVYARSRGITAPLPASVRFVMTPRWYDKDTGEAGRDHPAMVCAITNAADELTAVQCIYLMDGGRRKFEHIRDGKKSRAKLTWGLLPGSAIRLGPLADHIIVCEGPEDGLTLMQELPDKTVWVTCGTEMMHQVEFPEEVASVTLAGDNGEAGAKAVGKARVIYAKRGMTVEQSFPSHGFKDWNDQLRGVRS